MKINLNMKINQIFHYLSIRIHQIISLTSFKETKTKPERVQNFLHKQGQGSIEINQAPTFVVLQTLDILSLKSVITEEEGK